MPLPVILHVVIETVNGGLFVNLWSDYCVNDVIDIGSEGAGRLAGMLGQCARLAHLNLNYDSIGEVGAGRLAGVAGAMCTPCSPRSF